MTDDKQKEVLNGYEELKRRNRRRLVVASSLVAVSGILLGSAMGSGSDEAEEQPAKQVEVSAEQMERAAVLEPADKGETAAKSEADVPVLPAVPASDVEILKPAAVEAPQDIGQAPIVLVNDKLVDSDIKGLEESERIQKAEAAKREAEERRAEERRQQRLAEQRAKRAAEQQRKEAAAKESSRDAVKQEMAKAEAAAKKRAAAKAEQEKQQAERRQAAADKAAAERKAKQAEAKKDTAKQKETVKAEAAKAKSDEKTKKTAVKEAESKTAKAADKAQTAEKAKTAEKNQTAQKAKSDNKTAVKGGKAAIQAGYAEKERALSLQRKMKAEGINATITEVNTEKGKVYRVRSSGYKNSKDAERDLNKLRVHGIAGQVVKND